MKDEMRIKLEFEKYRDGYELESVRDYEFVFNFFKAGYKSRDAEIKKLREAKEKTHA